MITNKQCKKTTHRKTFWKTHTPFLSRKALNSTRIALIKKEVRISDDQLIAETLAISLKKQLTD